MDDNGVGAVKYFYQVRSNLSHRGKGAWKDSVLLLKATVWLHDAMRSLLREQLPELADWWAHRSAEEWLLGDLCAREWAENGVDSS
jgi:hypothetical protein